MIWFIFLSLYFRLPVEVYLLEVYLLFHFRHSVWWPDNGASTFANCPKILSMSSKTHFWFRSGSLAELLFYTNQEIASHRLTCILGSSLPFLLLFDIGKEIKFSRILLTSLLPPHVLSEAFVENLLVGLLVRLPCLLKVGTLPIRGDRSTLLPSVGQFSFFVPLCRSRRLICSVFLRLSL